MATRRAQLVPIALCGALLAPVTSAAQDADAELAKKLNNPVSSLVSVPFKLNFDCCYGPHEGSRETLNIQPVIPISLNDDWNMIVRTIVPVVHQERTSPTTGSEFGLSDVTQSFFLSPRSHGQITWAVGPVFLWPTGETGIGARQWGAGPTALVLRQTGGLTYGVLANHLWSYAELRQQNLPDVNATFVQPFVSYTTARHTTFGLNSEASYDWTHQTWTVPINVSVAHLYNFGGQRVQLTAGAKVYAAKPDGGPDWGLRLVATFLYPSK